MQTKLCWLSVAASCLLLSSCEAFVATPARRGVATFSSSVLNKNIQSLSAPASSGTLTPWTTTTTTTTALQAAPIVPPPISMEVSSSFTSSPLWTYFLETVIANGVPAAFTILVIGFVALQFRGFRKDAEQRDRIFNKSNNNNTPLAYLYDDLYGDMDQDPLKKQQKMPFGLFNDNKKDDKELPKNTGVPKLQYLKISNLNQKYDSYKYSLTAATQSKAAAAAQYRRTAWERALGRAAASLTPDVAQALQSIERDFLRKASQVQATMEAAQTALTQATIDRELQAMGMMESSASSSSSSSPLSSPVYQLDPAPAAAAAASSSNATASNNKNATTTSITSHSPRNKGQLMSDWVQAQQELQKLQLDFVQQVVATVGSEHAAAVRTALLGQPGNTNLLLHEGGERPLAALLGGGSDSSSSSHRKKLFVTRFPGDTTASQVAELRETVTGITQSCQPDDEVLVVLQTGGGTVTGYGLAAAQLLRLKDAGLRLTIAVEQVAASGGYMMSCVADKIVASPFAVLGSIGVISEMPNVYERLQREGIEFQTVTAGKYKRTLTPTKKVTREDVQKSKQEVEEILVLFRDWVAQNRPQLDIDKVATGETWFGTAALEKNLCDEIKTVDDVLTEYMADGFDVLEVEYKPPAAETALGKLLLPATTTSGGVGGVATAAVQWLVGTVATAVQAELADSTSALRSTPPVQERYRMQDDSADRIRSQD